VQDLTRGPIPGHIARLPLPIAIGMLLQKEATRHGMLLGRTRFALH
jgi:hypothetical protein